ncbi:unnamed protein product [Rhizophagus irregularis]|nr:unnamed protein product [Rhizophagus irregularis]
MAAGGAGQTNKGNLRHAKFSDVCAWVKRSWDGISDEIIIDSFKTCGISNALDEVEDFDNEIIDISDDDLEDGISDNLEHDVSDDNLEDDMSCDDSDIEYGSRYPAVRDLGIGATNAGKKVMRRGWIDRKEVSVTLPNIFDEIVPCIRKIDTANFVVVDKPEYYLVLGNVWLMHTGYAVDRHHQYTLINLKRSKNKKGKKDNIAVESECSSSEDESEDEEVAYNNNAPPPIIMDLHVKSKI